MDLAPNSTKFMECLKGYFAKTCFVLTRGVGWKLPTFATRNSPPPTRRRRHLASSSLLPRVEALGHGLAGVASRGRARLPDAKSLGRGRRRGPQCGSPRREGLGRSLAGVPPGVELPHATVRAATSPVSPLGVELVSPARSL
jgi:hypothetical protein